LLQENATAWHFAFSFSFGYFIRWHPLIQSVKLEYWDGGNAEVTQPGIVYCLRF
jgi:hypothetical protein